MTPKSKGPHHCILHVEDEQADAFILRFAFNKVGIDTPIHVVTDGQMAIDYLSGHGDFADRSRHPLPTLVLLDLKLPKRTGMEVLEWIRSQPHLHHLIVIICSSSALPGDLGRAYELGVNSFVQKPIGLGPTLRLAELFKGWWLQTNQFPTQQTTDSIDRSLLAPPEDKLKAA